MHFKDRHEAGIKLAEQLKKYKNNKDVIILAIPRGGVEVGYEIAKTLNVKLDIIVTKKIGLPDDDEFAIGSIGPDKKIMLNEETIRIYNVHEDYINEKTREIGREIERMRSKRDNLSILRYCTLLASGSKGYSLQDGWTVRWLDSWPSKTLTP